MMKILKENLVSILFFTILILSLVGCFVFLPSLENKWIESNAPAWIQAVGSIAAIIAASIIAKNQFQAERRLELEKQAESDVQKFKVIKALMARSIGLSKDICVAFDSGKDSDYEMVTPALMEDTHNVLLSLPTFEVPDGMLALDVLTVGRALKSLSGQWDIYCAEVASMGTLDVPIASSLLTLAQETQAVAIEALKICEREISLREEITGKKSGWGDNK